jgi:sigma-B regulation protein RsbU (phosphoserine phosphatase)
LEILLALAQPRELLSGIFWWFVAVTLFAFLLLMELRDKLDLKSDLEIAREIQVALVPSRPYQRDAISIQSFMRPANTVGGDYHDIVDLGDGKIGVMTGDVAGKGMPAALMMALLQGSLRTLITAGLRGTELIRRLNEYLFDNIPANKLVTLYYGELNTLSGEFHYVNAGHNAPFLLNPGAETTRLPATSLVLGVLRDAVFEARDIKLIPGQRLLLFTDGVNEVFNEKEEEYGEERMEAFLQKNNHLGDQELIQALVTDVLAFCEGSRPGDDMTLMCISMK